MRGRKKQYVQAEEEKKMKRIKEMGGRKEGGKVREWQRETEGENEKKERERCRKSYKFSRTYFKNTRFSAAV